MTYKDLLARWPVETILVVAEPGQLGWPPEFAGAIVTLCPALAWDMRNLGDESTLTGIQSMDPMVKSHIEHMESHRKMWVTDTESVSRALRRAGTVILNNRLSSFKLKKKEVNTDAK